MDEHPGEWLRWMDNGYYSTVFRLRKLGYEVRYATTGDDPRLMTIWSRRPVGWKPE